ncbi:hypothetical protein QQS21_011940 [Conoideocrella luteorostrata]|uniref:BZIP domain-containing protein n=1 Tax=Conoideocrella luteorostrata TaxID=1105319 RepID=A0AAJ0CEW1_9HYPO|nr:hypothetical protein QQS21_011940 [Conoideocrella luteorostrata]
MRRGPRNRPRIKSTNRTAANRRRTQLRLAQREYRERRNTIITNLQSRIKELEKAKGEMYRTFQEFCSVLFSEPVTKSAPDLALRLSHLADRVVRVADRAGVSSSDDGEDNSGFCHGHRLLLPKPAASQYISSKIPQIIPGEPLQHVSQQPPIFLVAASKAAMAAAQAPATASKAS